jgi:hypothetical protein
LLSVFVIPAFFALAGTPTPPRSSEPGASGTIAEFDPVACARLAGPEQGLCGYGPFFSAAGAQSQVDPALLAAVAYVESGFAPDVIDCTRGSSAGALGLMQFMPGTAQSRGVDPCDPREAIFGAAVFLRQLHDQFGAWELAVAAYNAGPGAVQRAGGIPVNGETERYVPRVMEKWDQYRALFPRSVGDCPQGEPSGGTDPVREDHITEATRAMANAVIGCFGRDGRDVFCFSLREANGGKYEHPRGRACDFMIVAGGGVAEGAARARGQAMAEWVAQHAGDLHVLYVIWYRRIWRPSDGDVPWEQWDAYHGDSPHTDHVHVSVKLMPGDPPSARCPPSVQCSE